MDKYKLLFFVFLAVFIFVELVAGLTSNALYELFGHHERLFRPLMSYILEINEPGILKVLLSIQIISIGGMFFCVIKQKIARVFKLAAIPVLASLFAVDLFFLYVSFLLAHWSIG